MRKKFERDEVGVFGRIKRKIGDFFYGISVKMHDKKQASGKVKTGTMKQKRRNQLIFYWALMALPIVQYCIFYIGVNFNSILLAFKQYRVTANVVYYDWEGIGQFKLFFENFFYGTALKQMLENSLIFYFFGLFITMPISLIFSFYIYKKFAGCEFFRIVLFLPSIISAVVNVFMYQFLLDVAIPELLWRWFDVEMMPVSGEADMRMTVTLIYNFLMAFGTNILMYSSAMSRIPESVVEYAAIDGVSPVREFFSITIPLIFDTISTFIVVGIAGIFTNQAHVYALYANNAGMEVQTFGYHLFTLINLGDSVENYCYAAAIGLTFTIIVFPLTMLVQKLLDKVNPNVQV